MKDLIRRFIKEEDGLGTVEMVVIVAVLLGIALIFRKNIFGFVNDVMSGIFGNSEVDGVRENPIPTPTTSN